MCGKLIFTLNQFHRKFSNGLIMKIDDKPQSSFKYDSLTKKINDYKNSILINNKESLKSINLDEIINVSEMNYQNSISTKIHPKNRTHSIKKDNMFLKPPYNLELSGSAKNLISNEESPKYSTSSYSTTSSKIDYSNKILPIVGEISAENSSIKENSQQTTTHRSTAINSLRKSKTFSSFENILLQRESLAEDKRRNFSYFANQSCKIKFNLEMDFLKKFSITNEKNLIDIKGEAFRKNNTGSLKNRTKLNNTNEFLIGKIYKFGILKNSSPKEEKLSHSASNVNRSLSFKFGTIKRRTNSSKTRRTKNSFKITPKIILTKTSNNELASKPKSDKLKKIAVDFDYTLAKKTSKSRNNSMNFLANAILTNKIFLNKREKHITYKLGAILITFVVSWLPFCFLWPLISLCSKCVPQSLYLFSFWLAYLNSIFTPLILLYNNSKYRRSLTFFKILFYKIFWCFSKNENLNFRNSSYYIANKIELNSRVNANLIKKRTSLY